MSCVLVWGVSRVVMYVCYFLWQFLYVCYFLWQG